jgi:GT2 family glycosyltransferase
MTATSAGSRISIAVLTHNRRERVLETVTRLAQLPEQCAIYVVDNGSSDGTAEALTSRFPRVIVVRLAANHGAAGRNAAAVAARTPYLAFCDDDTWWAPGSLSRAAELLDRHPDVAVLCARVLVGLDQRIDPTCLAMAASPLTSASVPGPLLLGFLAGACVVRREAFLAAGGYHPRLFLGAEEALLALDLTARGQWVVYSDVLQAHHHPAPRSDSRERASRLARNAVWIAWLRRPLLSAARESFRTLRPCGFRQRLAILISALRGAGWVMRERRVVPSQVERMRRAIDLHESARSSARYRVRADNGAIAHCASSREASRSGLDLRR